jgi:hypothetical protein
LSERFCLLVEPINPRRATVTASRLLVRHKLPETFAGYDRQLTRYPVVYPNACSPYALSSGAVLLLLRTMLGLDPDGDHLITEPAIPKDIGNIQLLDIPGRWGHTDAYGRGRPEVYPGPGSGRLEVYPAAGRGRLETA